MQPINSQPQSPLSGKLSREIRDLIYLELWKVSGGGLRQHIVWHGYPGHKRHFCRWPCSMPPWGPADELQREIGAMKENNEEVGTKHTRRLQSPWLNHWACGEDVAATTHADNSVQGRTTTALGPCWWDRSAGSQQRCQHMGSYMPMLLACKLISSECLESIYRSTTFVFTDLTTYQLFAGFCKLPPGWEKLPNQQPPAFFVHACKLEICLSSNFASSIPCAGINQPVSGPVHDVFDFHWLQLNRFDHLTDVKIWIASRAIVFWTDPNRIPNRTPLLVDLDVEALRKALWALKDVRSVAISAALHQDVKTVDATEDGFVDGVGPPSISLWKRGTGDHYHPYLGSINPGGIGDGILISSPQRDVQEEPRSRSITHVHMRATT